MFLQSITLALTYILIANAVEASGKEYKTKSGIRAWVDLETPSNRQMYTSSRGDKWELVMSDEFNTPDRSFKPGEDHIWTSLDKPDGVNGALEIYAHNMTSTECETDDKGEKVCYFYIKVVDQVTNIRVYNAYLNPPDYENVNFYYYAAMVQSWNKFCFQGGMIEVRAQLPGAINKDSGNPDLSLGSSGVTANVAYYPTWPGIWMLGNLGRAIFTASTSRMWPFSYDECDEDVFPSHNQRISACDDDPGYGLNPNQGRGAPEIDILEGGGTAISSSLQVGPGMPQDFRLYPADADGADAANPYCVYSYDCKTPGANYIDVPTSYYMKKRGHKSWYQGLRYSANNFCVAKSDEKQSYKPVAASVKKGISKNTCSVTTCPASYDVNGDLELIDGVGPDHWGINTNGTCFPVMNSYMGAYLCDPDNTNKLCSDPRDPDTKPSGTMAPFNYQMDAISSNWPVHVGAYTGFMTYQLEWVTGTKGYVRWMLDGHPIFEITADAFSNVPQNKKKSNPTKIMLEEPMYFIFNVALSSSWGATPPNAGNECRGDGNDKETNAICDSFPMYMKIDYIRLYQDVSGSVKDGSLMQIGCDPDTHPTKTWIEKHLDEYVDADNPWEEVAGKAFCKTDDDCTLGAAGARSLLITGKCEKSRCKCDHSDSWGGPRCTTALAETSSDLSSRVYGPPMELTLTVGIIALVFTIISIYLSARSAAKQQQVLMKSVEQKKAAMEGSPAEQRSDASLMRRPQDNYSQNFV